MQGAAPHIKQLFAERAVLHTVTGANHHAQKIPVSRISRAQLLEQSQRMTGLVEIEIIIGQHIAKSVSIGPLYDVLELIKQARHHRGAALTRWLLCQRVN